MNMLKKLKSRLYLYALRKDIKSFRKIMAELEKIPTFKWSYETDVRYASLQEKLTENIAEERELTKKEVRV